MSDEAFLSSLATKVQEVIFWRSPVAVAVSFIGIEGLFYITHRMELSFFAVLCLFAILLSAIRTLYSIGGDVLDSLLFVDHSSDAPERPNRIRTVSEIRRVFERGTEKVKRLREWFREYRRVPTPGKHLRFISVIYPMFILGRWIGTAGVLFVIVHAVMIVPAVVCSPMIREFLKRTIEKSRRSKDRAE
jgi:hypothetical protein